MVFSCKGYYAHTVVFYIYLVKLVATITHLCKMTVATIQRQLLTEGDINCNVIMTAVATIQKLGEYIIVQIILLVIITAPPPLLGIIWGYSGDLTYPDVKCPIVGQTECVKSPNTAPHKPHLQHGDLTWLHILKALSIYAFIKCPIVGQ